MTVTLSLCPGATMRQVVLRMRNARLCSALIAWADFTEERKACLRLAASRSLRRPLLSSYRMCST